MLVLALPASASAPAQPAPPAEARLAQVALVVDLSAGQTLYAQEAERQFLPASMTKAMSALVAFDLIKAGKLDQDAIVTVRPETAQRWAGKGTTLSLRPGDGFGQRRLGRVGGVRAWQRPGVGRGDECPGARPRHDGQPLRYA